MFWRKAKTEDPAEKVAISISRCFLYEEVHSELDSHGISKMSCKWKGKEINVSWYSCGGLAHGSPHSLSIDGDKFFPNKFTKIIFDSAQTRANDLIQDRLLNLASVLE